MTREEVIDASMRYRLHEPRTRRAKSLRFMDTYRSYVINYGLGTEIVGAAVEAGER